MSRVFAGSFQESPEMPGNKREQIATRRDMKTATREVAEIELSL